MDRRPFLAALLGTTGAVVLAHCAGEESESGDAGEGGVGEKVLVIGAGMSGLAAASALKAAGFEVEVLEGRSRIGGRTFTDRSRPDAPLDLGASWIHGVDGNPMTNLAAQYGAATKVTDYEDATLYGIDGKEYSDAEQDAIDARFDELISALDDLSAERRAAGAPDISVQQGIDEVLAAGTLGALSQAQLAELTYSVNTTIEHEEATDVSDLSLRAITDEADSGTGAGEGPVGMGADAVVVGGYDKITSGLAEGLTIRLGQVVQKIEHAEDGVTITTNGGVFEADRVVVTLPLGVLKAGTVLFEPPLPAAKTAALEHLGMSVLDKVYLRFGEVFWEDVTVLGHVSAEKGQWCETLNFAKVAGEPTLLCFNAGAFGLAVEAMSDAEVVAGAMAVLRSFYGVDVPEPVSFLITRWGADPFALGSYSHTRPGGGDADFDALAAPIADRVFFAGEATDKDNAATTHGAYLSGLREAARIAELVGVPGLGEAYRTVQVALARSRATRRPRRRRDRRRHK